MIVSPDPSYLTVLDCTTVVLTLSGNDVFWGTGNLQRGRPGLSSVGRVAPSNVPFETGKKC